MKGKLRLHTNDFNRVENKLNNPVLHSSVMLEKWGGGEGTWPKSLPETFIHPTVRNGRRQRSHSHTVQVNELALPLVALCGQEVFKVLDLVSQLRVQVELGWKLGDPVPGGRSEAVEICTLCTARAFTEKYHNVLWERLKCKAILLRHLSSLLPGDIL